MADRKGCRGNGWVRRKAAVLRKHTRLQFIMQTDCLLCRPRGQGFWQAEKDWQPLGCYYYLNFFDGWGIPASLRLRLRLRRHFVSQTDLHCISNQYRRGTFGVSGWRSRSRLKCPNKEQRLSLPGNAADTSTPSKTQTHTHTHTRDRARRSRRTGRTLVSCQCSRVHGVYRTSFFTWEVTAAATACPA